MKTAAKRDRAPVETKPEQDQTGDSKPTSTRGGMLIALIFFGLLALFLVANMN